MTEVSGKFVADLRDYLQLQGCDVAAWRDGVPIPDERLFDRRGRVPWDAFAVLMERFEPFIAAKGGCEAFVRHSFDDSSSWAGGFFGIGRLAVSPRALYWMGNTLAAPSLFPMIQGKFTAETATRFRVELSLPETYRACPAFWRVSAISLRLVPLWIGLPESAVDLEYGPYWARYVINAPQGMTLWSRALTFFRLLFRGQRVFDDFVERQSDLLATLRELHTAQAELRGLNEQLDERVRQRTAALEAANAALLDAKLRADAASQAKSTFVANMSHEVRTPLTAILGFTEIMLREDLPRTEDRSRVEVIRRNAEHLHELLNGVLDLAQIEAGGYVAAEPVPVDPRAELTSMAETYRALAQRRHLAFHLEIAADVPALVSTDRLRLRQILANLLGNALKFTERGEIEVNARCREPGLLEISVRDTGCGIADAQKDKLFQAFSQGDSSHTRRFGGSGLGLHLAREFARLLGGDVVLVASAVGRGSTFALRLPLAPP